MTFEFDPAKSLANQEKHGIDFEEAQWLWLDDERVELPSKEPREACYLVIGVIRGRRWAAIVTYRDDRIRVISVRRARKKEIEIYES